jgi:hypothetical protein
MIFKKIITLIHGYSLFPFKKTLVCNQKIFLKFLIIRRIYNDSSSFDSAKASLFITYICQVGNLRLEKQAIKKYFKQIYI